MEDSPLSIAANIAGLLTFVAAIWATIWIRYTSLQNGWSELFSVRNSVTTSFQDRNTADLDSPHPGDDDPGMVWLKKLETALDATNTVINASCLSALGVEMPRVYFHLSDLRDAGINPTTCGDVARDINEARSRPILAQRIFRRVARYVPGYGAHLSVLLNALQTVLTAGVSPTLIRWYGMRERVLEIVRQRDVFRARILSHKVSMANSSAKKHAQMLYKLVGQQAEVKVQLEELTRLFTAANQAPARPESIHDRGGTSHTQVVMSLGQQESDQSPTSAGNTEISDK